MRRLFDITLATVLLCAPAAGEITNRVVARVNDRILTLYEYDTRFQEALQTLQDVPQDALERQKVLDELARNVMRTLWDELLILSRADQAGLTVTDSEVDEQIAAVMEANNFGTIEQLNAALTASGMTMSRYRDQLSRQLTYRKLIGREVFQRLDIEEEDLRRYYRDHPEEFEVPEEVQVQEVVVLDAGDVVALEASATRVREALISGTPMAELATVFEDVALSDVIDLGWVVVDDLDAQIAAALAGLEVGSYSEAVEARGGLHIAHLLDRREAHVRPFTEIEPELRQQQENLRLDAEITEYLIELENKAFFTLDPPPEAVGFRSSTGQTPLPAAFQVVEPEPEESESDEPESDAAD
jgi:peptidyl-prolyl cis-trans isomerase SurA